MCTPLAPELPDHKKDSYLPSLVLAGHPSSHPLNPSSKPTVCATLASSTDVRLVGIGLSLCDAQCINIDRENPTNLMILDLLKKNQIKALKDYSSFF